MNRSDFLNMIGEEVPVNRQFISEVSELIDIFPYFHSAHMLLLKGLQNVEDIKFETQLRNSAIHITDREVLYYRLQTNPSEKIELPGERQVGDSSENTLSDSQQTVIESAKNSDYLINEIEKHTSGNTNKEESGAAEHIQGHSILISSESDNDESADVMLFIDEEPDEDEDKIFYMDPGFSFPENEDLLELDLTDNKTYSPGIAAGNDPLSAGVTVGPEKNRQNELIDKFISANPRIEPVRDKTEYSAGDISTPYAEDRGSFVTETLANIYLKQGYYSKAIDIYEKLSLKFPEKSSYFASQIEKVKEYIKK